MSSRDDILNAVRRNRPPDVPLPHADNYPAPADDVAELFLTKVRQIAGEAFLVDSASLEAAVSKHLKTARQIAAIDVPLREAIVLPKAVSDPHALAGLDALVCRGMLGVAENGAVWIPESSLGQRAAPFLANHLVVVLDENRIVNSMHDAYAQLSVAEEGFGLFIAGPSKTADIEQVLVIGAHGPKRHTVFVVRA